MPHELERLHQLLVTFARDHADAIAVQGATECFTFRQLLAEVGLRTHSLRGRSPGPLVLALDNGPQLLFWDLAALFALAIEQRIAATRLADLAAPYPSYADLARQLGEQAARAAPVSALDARLFALNRLFR